MELHLIYGAKGMAGELEREIRRTYEIISARRCSDGR